MPGAADASPPPLVDAGSSLKTPPDAAFALSAHAEGFAAAPSFAWTAPADCIVADASAAQTSATCATSGKKVFQVAATAGSESASDTVAIVVGTITRTVLLSAEGSTTAGAAHASVPLSQPIPFVVPEGVARLEAVVTWRFAGDDYDVTLTHGSESYVGDSTDADAEVLVVEAPSAGDWNATVSPWLAYLNTWYLSVEAVSVTFDADLPIVNAPGWVGVPGSTAALVARGLRGEGTLDLAWESDASSRRFDDGAGSLFETAFDGAKSVLVKATDSEGYEAVLRVELREPGALARPLTVVAVIDSSFSVYHYDFLGSAHPWNVDADPSNDIDFAEHPRAYIESYPEASTPLLLDLPTSPDANSDALRESDAPLWALLGQSNATETDMRWIPGTKVIGALRFNAAFTGVNGAHGTASASVAAGNIHGTCPECLFVLVSGGTDAALAWAASQPWIDVVTNSYGAGGPVQNATLGLTRDNMYLYSPIEATRAASEEGQVIVFSAGNGFVNAFDVPMFTYWSSQKGPDWMITVGAVDPTDEQTYDGAGKPVDMSSIGSGYASAGGSTATGEGEHSGTSNAAPTSAGYFAKVLQRSRELLGDASVGHAAGVVASGVPVTCGDATPACALGDGVLTRGELVDLVFSNILPSPQVFPGDDPQTIPTQEHAYYYQGYGVVSGLVHGKAHYESEWTRMVDVATGALASFARPDGEEEWFVVDSKCRQRVWGAWSQGAYAGSTPVLDPMADPVAFAFDAWCSALPQDAGLTAAATVPRT